MKRFYLLFCAIFMVTCLHSASVPHLKEIQALSLLNPSEKAQLTQGWNQLYQLQQQNAIAPTAPTPAQLAALKPLMSINYFDLMATWCKDFAQLKTTQNPHLQNYCAYHLAAAAQRLASVCSINLEESTPQVTCTGDIRDFGIIVNVHNHTNTTFTLLQSTTKSAQKAVLGSIAPGLNEVNLHLAALQAPAARTATTPPTAATHGMFELISTNSQIPTNIYLRIYTGKELKNFLRTLPRKDPKIFSMNGLPTSQEFLANDTSWYLVLIQNPSSSSQPEANFDQRIQAINLSAFAGPYLLKMQINQDSIEIISEDKNQVIDYFQPSLTNAFVPNSQHTSLKNMPFLILNSTLWQNSAGKTLWTMTYTCYLAALTNYKFFGSDTFGNAYSYFNELGFFNPATEFSFFIDHYNTSQFGYTLNNAQWLMSTGIYETNISTTPDIPQIYTAQDNYGNITVNEQNFYDTTFITMFEPKNTQTTSVQLFDTKGLSAIYGLPQYQLYSTITNALQTDIKQGIFGELTKIDDVTYKVVYTNKKRKTLSSQIISLDSPISNIQITFVNQSADWAGSALPMNLIPTVNNSTTHFKVTYEYSITNNRHILLAQATSIIDKQEAILPLYFSGFPIQSFYIDFFETYNVTPFTRHHIIQNGTMPQVLSGLIEQDWKNGVYMIPSMQGAGKTMINNPDQIVLTFYKHDKTIIGQLPLTGISHPISCYCPHFSSTNYLADLYMNTGVLLRYNQ